MSEMKNRIKLLQLLLIAILISGIGQMNTLTAQNESEDEEESGEVTGGAKYGEDSAKCVMNLSLYYEFYKQWKQSDYKNTAFKDAINPWRWVFLNCPLASQNVYIHGLRMTEQRIQNETDKIKREKLVDTMMMIYDQRIQYFGKEGYNLGRKGVDLYKLRPNSYEETYNILKKSIELEGNKTLGDVLIYYFRTAEKMVKAEKEDKTLLVNIYDEASEIIDHNIKKYASEPKKLVNWENIKNNIELSFEPYASCEDLISIYSLKFDENPEDVELLKKITKILDKKNCNDSELFFKATENLHKSEPTAQSALLMGKMYYNKKEYSKAGTYFKESTELFDDPEKLGEAWFFLANVQYIQKNYSAARSSCYKSLEYNPANGNAYLLIGDMYAASSGSCGNDDIAKKAPYWAAVDKYYKAKSVDPSVADVANSRINTYTQHFPLKEELFFHDYKNGDSYKVECWINETTTVRSSD